MFCCKGVYETPPTEWSLDLRFEYNLEMPLNLNPTDFLFQHNNQATWGEASPEGSVCVVHITNCWFKQILAEVDSLSALDFGSVSSQYVLIHFLFFIDSFFFASFYIWAATFWPLLSEYLLHTSEGNHLLLAAKANIKKSDFTPKSGLWEKEAQTWIKKTNKCQNGTDIFAQLHLSFTS